MLNTLFMWEILHWYFIFLMEPNPLFHLVAGFVLFALSIKTPLKRKDILPGLCLFSIYLGYKMSPKLEHYCFLPWWVVSITGMRNRDMFIWTGGIITGVYLVLSSAHDVSGHLLMNLGKMYRNHRLSVRGHALVHMISMIIYVEDRRLMDVAYKDFLVGLSCVMDALSVTPPDLFSMCMMFSSPIALSTFVLQGQALTWYKLFKNNHFKMVKHSLYFVYPVSIVFLAYGMDLYSWVRELYK